jgi:hypothetical protein
MEKMYGVFAILFVGMALVSLVKISIECIGWYRDRKKNQIKIKEEQEISMEISMEISISKIIDWFVGAVIVLGVISINHLFKDMFLTILCSVIGICQYLLFQDYICKKQSEETQQEEN